MPAAISAISYYLPEKVLSNEDFFREFPEARETSLEKVGVRERHIAAENESGSDMACAAAEQLFSEHGIDRSTIEFVIFCSADLDHYTPATAGIVQHRLGLPQSCGSFDMFTGCSAYPYALGVSAGLIDAMGLGNLLLITSSALTRKIHPRDRASRFMFGDAAAATLLTRSETGQIGPFVFGTDGGRADKLIVPHGGSRQPLGPGSYEEIADEFGNVTSPAHFQMEGVGVFIFSMKTVPPMVRGLLEKAKLGMEDIDLFVFHQANVFMNETLRQKLGIPPEKFVHCMERFGNTVQSSIPIALREAQKEGRLKPGMRVLLAGFGTGLSWSATIVRS